MKQFMLYVCKNKCKITRTVMLSLFSKRIIHHKTLLTIHLYSYNVFVNGDIYESATTLCVYIIYADSLTGPGYYFQMPKQPLKANTHSYGPKGQN